jgi:hypothetical protein
MNEMLKGLKSLGNAAMEKAEEYGKIATEKAEELTKLGKIKLDIHQLNRSRSKTLENLGELVVNLAREDKLGDLAKHENYLALQKTLAELETELQEKETLAANVAAEEAQQPDEEQD